MSIYMDTEDDFLPDEDYEPTDEDLLEAESLYANLDPYDDFWPEGEREVDYEYEYEELEK